MNINFKVGYFNFNFFKQIRLDFVQWVHWQCPVSPWTQSRLSSESMDNVHWVHGQCPLNPWTLSSLAGLTGLCPWTHWTLSRVSMDIVQTVHWVHGKCPLSSWTVSRDSTESMDFLQTGFIYCKLGHTFLSFSSCYFCMFDNFYYRWLMRDHVKRSF